MIGDDELKMVSMRVTQSFRDRGQVYRRGEILHVREETAREWRRHGVAVFHQVTRSIPTRSQRCLA